MMQNQFLKNVVLLIDSRFFKSFVCCSFFYRNLHFRLRDDIDVRVTFELQSHSLGGASRHCLSDVTLVAVCITLARLIS